MNKSEFITHIAIQHSITKADAENIIDKFVSSTISALKAGNEISLVGFGSFTISDVAGRTGRNPKTQEPMEIAAYKQAKFKVGQKIKDAVNGK